MSHMEEAIAAPEATPERILELVSSLGSSTVTVPRTFSPTLLSRLQDISSHHGGTVQLHGRLFAQWMHHAYPRECPFPHVAGTSSRLKPLDDNVVATKEEMEQYVYVPTTVEEISDHHDLMMWTFEEELVATRPSASGGLRSFVRGAFYLAVIACMMSVGWNLLQTALSTSMP